MSYYKTYLSCRDSVEFFKIYDALDKESAMQSFKNWGEFFSKKNEVDKFYSIVKKSITIMKKYLLIGIHLLVLTMYIRNV